MRGSPMLIFRSDIAVGKISRSATSFLGYTMVIQSYIYKLLARVAQLW